MPNKLVLTVLITAVLACIFTVGELAQTAPSAKSFILNGTVEQINDFPQTIRVKQERIPGYSEARLATYNLEDPSILKKLEVGDRIVAKIYDKDDKLYDIQIVRIDDHGTMPHIRLQPPK